MAVLVVLIVFLALSSSALSAFKALFEAPKDSEKEKIKESNDS